MRNFSGTTQIINIINIVVLNLKQTFQNQLSRRPIVKLLRSAVVALSILCPTYAWASINSNIEFDSNGNLFGWAYDIGNPTISIQLQVYSDGLMSRGNNIGSILANSNSDDLDNYFGITGAHRFSWSSPQIDNKTVHIYFVYGVDAAGNISLLNTSGFVYPAVTAGIALNSPQTVFDATSEGCDANDFPDHPARAFRTADNQVSLIASWIYVRRMIGWGLNSLVHDCNVIYTSAMDKTYEKFSYFQWLQSPYTVDGKTVYNITHNEWYGALVNPNCNGDLVDGWVSALTLTVSNDMGRTFHQPANYLIRHPQKSWDNSFPCSTQNPTRYGDLGGSNIIYNGGFYYKFFYYEPEPLVSPPTGWQCLMKTWDLGNPNAYKVLTNDGWTQSPTAPCAPVSGSYFFRSVTYNTYIQKYVAIMQFNQGFGFSLSSNLRDWSAPSQINFKNLDTTEWMYPALLDPSDPSLNFEYSGRSPFIYYMNYTKDLKRSQMRIRIQFSVPNGDPTLFNQQSPAQTNVSVPSVISNKSPMLVSHSAS